MMHAPHSILLSSTTRWLKTTIRRLALLGFCIMTSLGHAQQKGGAASNSEAKERELDELRARAAQGVPWAQVTLGELYAEGDETTKNPVEAVRLWKLAAAQNYAPAFYHLGRAYSNGFGVSKDAAMAATCWNVSAEMGDILSQVLLATAYATGEGRPLDLALAVKWHRRAADQGDPISQFMLSSAYANGEGVAQNNAEAFNWCRKSAEQGFVEAQNRLGFMYARGQGVDRDLTEASKWHRKAADQGDSEAQDIQDQFTSVSVSLPFGNGLYINPTFQGIGDKHTSKRSLREVRVAKFATGRFESMFAFGNIQQLRRWISVLTVNETPHQGK